jgi:DNA ligase-1
MINKAYPKLIPVPGYMRCSLPKETNIFEWPWLAGVISQEKLNGSFLNVTFNDSVQLMTRKGQFYAPESFKEIVEAVDLCFPNKHQAHGEILVIRDDKILSRSTGNGILNHVRKGGSFKSNEKPFLNLWDIVSLKVLEGEEKGQPYAVRYAMLKEICYMRRNILQVVPNRVVYSYAEAIEHFKEIRSKGGEGTVIKHPDGLWQNTTSRFQVKVKDEKEADLRVIGKNAGKGKNITTFGSLICITEDEQLLVSVSGFTDKQREEINENFDKYLYRIIPVLFTDLIKAKNSETYSMENPRVDSKSFEVRTDKDEADTLDRLLQM